MVRSESMAMRAELESAAELAERQNALTITLEGKLEGVLSDKTTLQKQLNALQSEMEEVKGRLTEDLTSIVPLLKTVTRAANSSAVSEAGALLSELRQPAGRYHWEGG